MSLEKIDTSNWLTKDKVWMESRKIQWLAIERVVKHNRRKTEVNTIKQYFLRGKMPNWEKYRDWDDTFRHLDLNLFLWLHPSNDPEILKVLYKLYIESDLIHPRDVILGYGSFFSHEFMIASSTRDLLLEEYPFPFMGGKNIILFRIMLEDLTYVKAKFSDLVAGNKNFEKQGKHVLEIMGYDHFLRMRLWLMQDPQSPFCLNNLYQYDDALEWCLTTLTSTHNKEFLKGLVTPKYIQAYQKSLYCLYHFDAKKEGNTGRTHFVHKIRKILDEREFIPEFKQMWLDVKAGKIEVKKPWKR